LFFSSSQTARHEPPTIRVVFSLKDHATFILLMFFHHFPSEVPIKTHLLTAPENWRVFFPPQEDASAAPSSCMVLTDKAPVGSCGAILRLGALMGIPTVLLLGGMSSARRNKEHQG